jgi:hypothetical protein
MQTSFHSAPGELRFPASRLREVNRILENTGRSSYRTEFDPTCDYKPTGLASHEKAQAKWAAPWPIDSSRSSKKPAGWTGGL